ncbi:MAG: GGDEF domain-containing protein [Roseburia sp.]
MYHSKKIGVFISHIMGHYQKNVCQGIIDKSLEYGYTAEIFATLDGENLGDYGIGEESILHIPNYADYDGIIFASETYPLPKLKEQILSTLQEKCTCPVVEIAVANQHFPAVALDNSSMTRQITEHLIQKHHYKRICYLGCSLERYFSDSREKYYRSAMDEASLPVGNGDIYICDYKESQVADALSFFLKNGKPDAVICYNDRMALLFMAAVKSAGYHIPDDIAVTGCDYTEDGQNATPSLTTVTFPVYELGVKAVENLLLLMQQEEVPAVTEVSASPVYAASCGCEPKHQTDCLLFHQALTRRIESLETSILTSMRMSAALQHISDLDDGMEVLENYIHAIDGCHEFYLCLYSDWDSVSSQILELTNSTEEETVRSDEILLKLAIRDGKRLPECSFRRTADSALLLDYIYETSNSAYIYTPLFFEEKEFGYVVLSYKGNKLDYHFQLVHWFMNINQMLQNICEEKCNLFLIHHLEDVYTKDALTGLYNKHGYLQHAEPLLKAAAADKSNITCFLFDLDNLKKINDTFGHAEGDFALQVIGQALSGAIQPADICARFSGDEFYLLTAGYTKKDADDLLVRVQKYLSNYNRLSKKNYAVSVSSGYAYAPATKPFTMDDVEKLFSKADESMYRQKKSKH